MPAVLFALPLVPPLPPRVLWPSATDVLAPVLHLLKVSRPDCGLYQTRFLLVGQVLAQALVPWLGSWSLAYSPAINVARLVSPQALSSGELELQNLMRLHNPLSKIQFSEELKTEVSEQEKEGGLTSSVCLPLSIF